MLFRVKLPPLQSTLNSKNHVTEDFLPMRDALGPIPLRLVSSAPSVTIACPDITGSLKHLCQSAGSAEIVGGRDTCSVCEAVGLHFSPNIYLDQF